jgi:aspartyl-tRNA(Asn)/glutamyl-tRNA(Gln) amidotransferase subunit A
MTRTVEDAAIILQAIAGRDNGDASTTDEPVPDYAQMLRQGVQGLRIGLPTQFFFENVDAEVESAVRSAVGLLADMGAILIEVDIPLISEVPGGVTAIMLPEALAYHQKWMSERPDDYGDDVRYRLELGASFLAVHYVQAQRLRETAVEAWREEVFSKVDLIVTPTTSITARPIEEGDLQVTFNLIRFTNPLNFLGVPAISVPCGFTGEGLPVGLQIAGRWWDEASVLRAAYAYEQATDWHRRRPPL